ncbi:cytochrome c oxidase subunit II [Tuberibacillus calidus]|jgi:cytochrome o ubiquinol oxidase subunit II|uniref:cytochrome c oxidase subunit II n=1 Tax=Tuberibacillus calidus TaxID=340097 RepID=UPI0003F80452|nr:cytochrome c oxidase subunit II [Tuberibacillus calidus]
MITKRRLVRLKNILMLLLLFVMTGCSKNYIVLDPKGPVGHAELRLIILSTILIAIVCVPVILLMLYIVYRYRDTPDNNAPYAPNWESSRLLEIIWWGVPIIIVAILGYHTTKGIYGLVKPPTTDKTPITIQVTSLDWKWLFQYPDQNIATVNHVRIPTGVPVQFVLTSDAPMNSFWVPQLGGQEYTMPGMAMRLWLQADHPGKYFGTGANFSGEGFAHMRFPVIAESQADFNQWVKKVKKTAPPMTQSEYEAIKNPGLIDQRTYSSYPPNSFVETLMKNGHHHTERRNENHDVPSTGTP